MDAPSGWFAQLWGHRVWLATGVVVAIVVTASRFVSIGVLPPSVKLKQLAHATASTELLVGKHYSLRSSPTRDPYVNSAVPRAQALADMMASPQIRGYIGRAAGLPSSRIAVDTPVWTDVERIQQWPTGEKRGTQIIMENAPYRITVDVEDYAPVIDVATQAPTTEEADALASGAEPASTTTSRTSREPRELPRHIPMPSPNSFPSASHLPVSLDSRMSAVSRSRWSCSCGAAACCSSQALRRTFAPFEGARKSPWTPIVPPISDQPGRSPLTCPPRRDEIAMELAKTLLKLWSLRVWIAVGAVIALLASVASLTLLPSKVYATASTQLVVDAPRSALGDAQKDLTPYTARAFVFARLMTTPQALQYIGQAAGVPGNLISASGPTELTGTQATHAPTAVQGTQLDICARTLHAQLPSEPSATDGRRLRKSPRYQEGHGARQRCGQRVRRIHHVP